jgi:hypothetical protein
MGTLYKAQLGIATKVLMITVKITIAHIEFQFPLNNLSLLWPSDAKICICVAYIIRQLEVATRCL